MKQVISRAVQCLVVVAVAGLCRPAQAQNAEKVETGEPVAAVDQAAKRAPIQMFVGGSLQAQTDIDKAGEF